MTDGTQTRLVECKHARGAVTAADVDRLRLVSNAGFRTDGRERCETAGVYHSGSRELTRLERALAP
ncbi:MAG TPA: hypothetical protein VGM69_01580 [Chloroflexota bacterium]